MNNKLKTFLYFPITKIFLSAGCILMLFIGIKKFLLKPLFSNIISDESIAKTLINYFTIGVLLLSYYVVFRFYEKRKITEISSNSLITELLSGFAFGFAVISLVILILYSLGYYLVLDISNYAFFLAPLSTLVAAALIEELFFRAILYRSLENWLGTFIALFIMSFLFELPHTFNENSTLLSFILGVLFGFAHGIMFTYTGRIWLPFGFHLGWNFAQPFYGSNLSGLENLGSIIKATFDGPKLLTGTSYGIEDSIFSIIFLIIICTVFLLLSIKEGKIKKFKKHSLAI